MSKQQAETAARQVGPDPRNSEDLPSECEIVSTESYLLSSVVGRIRPLRRRLPAWPVASRESHLQRRRSNGAAWHILCNEREGATLMTDRRSAARLWAALLVIYLVWGSTYLAIRVVVQGGLPPLLSMGIRFLLAAPLLAAFVALRSGLGRLGGGMADVERWGILLTLLAATCWGIGSFYSRSWGVPTDSLVATVYQMAVGGIAAVAMGLARGEGIPLQVGALPASTWVAFGYLVLVGSMVAYTAYAWLLQNAPISLTATYAYVNPAVAVVLGALILSEPVTGVVLIGGGLAILGVALVVTAEPPRTAAPKLAVTPAPSSAAAPDRA